MTPTPHPPTTATQDAGLARLNAMDARAAADVLRSCCGSRRWVERMVVCRPFASVTILLGGADLIWLGLDRKDWLEAFAHHPRIGERDLSQTKFAATAIQAGKEQSGMAVATDAQRAEFAAGNEQYEQKFGHVFLICATGKIASQMLEQLRQRLNNDAAAELTNAAREQSAITRLRLERWLNT